MLAISSSTRKKSDLPGCFWILMSTFGLKKQQLFRYLTELKLYTDSGLLVGSGKKSNFAGFSGTNSRKKRFHGNFAGIFGASFAEKWLVKNGRFHGSFPSKFCLKAIGFALIWGTFSIKLDALIALTQASYRNLKSYFSSIKLYIEHDKNK